MTGAFLPSEAGMVNEVDTAVIRNNDEPIRGLAWVKPKILIEKNISSAIFFRYQGLVLPEK